MTATDHTSSPRPDAVRLGVVLVPTDDWRTTTEAARRVERLGFDHVWIYDHLSWRRYHDRPWHATYPLLTAIGMETSTIRLGTMVANLNVRHPVTLAKDAMTIDHIADGRFVLGIGAGGLGYDAEVLGQAPLTPGERASRLDEATRVVDGLLRGELRDHHGDWYDVTDARVLPGCLQRPRVPLVVAAGAPRTLGTAARHGDAWITYGATGSWNPHPDSTALTVAEQVGVLDDHCERIGRDPTSIDRMFMSDNSDERPLESLDAFDDVVGRYRELGFDDLVFHLPRPGDPVWDADPEIVDAIADRYLTGRPARSGDPSPTVPVTGGAA